MSNDEDWELTRPLTTSRSVPASPPGGLPRAVGRRTHVETITPRQHLTVHKDRPRQPGDCSGSRAGARTPALVVINMDKELEEIADRLQQDRTIMVQRISFPPFVREYLLAHGEAYIHELYRNYNDMTNELKLGKGIKYSSAIRTIHRLNELGLIKHTRRLRDKLSSWIFGTPELAKSYWTIIKSQINNPRWYNPWPPKPKKSKSRQESRSHIGG